MNEYGTKYYTTTICIDTTTGEQIKAKYIKNYIIIKTKTEKIYNNLKTICNVKKTKYCRPRQQLELFK